MITFDLACDQGHAFEGWFQNLHAFEEQLAASQIHCPLCDSVRITKKLSAVAVHTSKGHTPHAQPAPTAAPEVSPRAIVQAFAQFVETHFEDVGERFADEARKIHDEEAPARSIRGSTTPEEEQSLREEGVEFIKLALPKYDA
jgi:hypothetical protein